MNFVVSLANLLTYMNIKPLVAELIETFALVFVAVGAIAADHTTGGGSGLTGIALANGLTIATMVAAVGAIRGAHFSPAVTVAMLAKKRMFRMECVISLLNGRAVSLR
ncbi:MAG: aquaporin [Candidatus Omnitrophica bacterium]|nr:aquaporin [Candidatus Omnitrophota bacterium]